MIGPNLKESPPPPPYIEVRNYRVIFFFQNNQFQLAKSHFKIVEFNGNDSTIIFVV